MKKMMNNTSLGRDAMGMVPFTGLNHPNEFVAATTADVPLADEARDRERVVLDERVRVVTGMINSVSNSGWITGRE
jgi:hypothetical protein